MKAKILLVCSLLISTTASAGYSTTKLQTMEAFATLINEAKASGQLSKTECLFEMAELNGMKDRAEAMIKDTAFSKQANEIVASVDCQ